jgi:hypothetical protein
MIVAAALTFCAGLLLYATDYGAFAPTATQSPNLYQVG